MKCFKGILALIASLVLVSGAFADNKTDQIAKQVKELEAQVSSLEDLSTTLAAEDKVNAWLTLSGYIEMSAGMVNIESNNETDDAEATFMDVGIVEFVFDFDFSDQLSASIHVTSEKNTFGTPDFSPEENYTSALSALFIEEAWFRWAFASVEGLSLKAGIQDVNPGLEATESVDLYQFSTASITPTLPKYVQGLTLAYETEKFNVSLTLADGLGVVLPFLDMDGSPDGNIDEFGFMLKASVKIGENGLVQIAFGQEDADAEDGGDDDYTFFNIWGTYTIGQFEVAAEFAAVEGDGNITTGPTSEPQEWMGFILRGTYNINDKWSVTVRYDYIEEDESGYERTQFIISPAVKVSENLSILAEIGFAEDEDDSGYDGEAELFVIEAFLTF